MSSTAGPEHRHPVQLQNKSTKALWPVVPSRASAGRMGLPLLSPSPGHPQSHLLPSTCAQAGCDPSHRPSARLFGGAEREDEIRWRAQPPGPTLIPFPVLESCTMQRAPPSQLRRPQRKLRFPGQGKNILKAAPCSCCCCDPTTTPCRAALSWALGSPLPAWYLSVRASWFSAAYCRNTSRNTGCGWAWGCS